MKRQEARFPGPGRYVLVFDGRDDQGEPLGSGVYLYRLETDLEARIGKMLLLK